MQQSHVSYCAQTSASKDCCSQPPSRDPPPPPHRPHLARAALAGDDHRLIFPRGVIRLEHRALGRLRDGVDVRLAVLALVGQLLVGRRDVLESRDHLLGVNRNEDVARLRLNVVHALAALKQREERCFVHVVHERDVVAVGEVGRVAGVRLGERHSERRARRRVAELHVRTLAARDRWQREERREGGSGEKGGAEGGTEGWRRQREAVRTHVEKFELDLASE
jgi:hypothetical protein